MRQSFRPRVAYRFEASADLPADKTRVNFRGGAKQKIFNKFAGLVENR